MALLLCSPAWVRAQNAPPPVVQPPTPSPSPTGPATAPAVPPGPAAEPAPAPTTPPAAPAAPAPAAPAPAPSDDDLRFALVHIASDYPGTWLELRDFVESGEWVRTCQAPCDRKVRVEGSEARVSAEGMTTSNVFRIEPGRGRALIKVDGGSQSTKNWGVGGMIVGIPLSLVGMGLLGYGIVQEKDSLQIAGGITLGVGATIVLGSLPLLVLGGTDVHDGKGKQIAGSPSSAW